MVTVKKNRTETLLLETSKRISTLRPESRILKLVYNGLIINSTSSYKYLGSVLDQNLDLAENFERKFKKTSSRLVLLRKLRQKIIQLNLTKLS